MDRKTIAGLHGTLGTINIKGRFIMRALFFSMFLIFATNLYCQDFENCYIEVNSSTEAGIEYFLIEDVGDRYFVTFIRPTISGRRSLSRFWVGVWNGREIVLDNGFSVHGINKQENGNLFYYHIKDVGEFPGKDFRPITREDLDRITSSSK